MKENPTNGDSIMLKIMNFIEANNKIQTIDANKAILNIAVRDQLRKKEVPFISIKVKEARRGIEELNK